MNNSIRTFLLINLMLCITLITLISIIANLFFQHRQLDNILKTNLTKNAQQISQIYQESNDKTSLSAKKILLRLSIYTTDNKSPPKKNFIFLVRNKSGKLLVKFTNETYIQQILSGYTNQPGFHQHIFNQVLWRMFTFNPKGSDINIVIGEKYHQNNAIESEFARDSILIMIITYPFLALLIWLVVGKALKSIQSVTDQLSLRKPERLKPIRVKHVPKEITPFILELNNLLMELKSTLAREKRFAADAAHELRTPLAALRLQTQLALNSHKKADSDIALRKILASVDRSTHIVQQLLTLSRMVPEATLNNIEIINLLDVITDANTDISSQARDKNITISINASYRSYLIMGNNITLLIMMKNLLDNSVRYCAENSIIQLFLEDQGDKIVLRIEDNGPGIPKKLKGRVFERFYRIIGNDATGSGLGLSIVKQIITLHNAKISLTSPVSEKQQGLAIKIIFKAAKL